ncbi:MAG: hypothetical protein V4787_11635 [Pseudomonadota bacterium]
MGLKNFAQARHVIQFGDNDLNVRGLSANDVTAIIFENKSVVEDVFSVFEDANLTASNLDDEKLKTFIGNIAIRAPYVVASIIAHASDEPDEYENAAKLPLPVQTEALIEIARLTFNDKAGFERFMGNVKAAVASVKKAGLPLQMTGTR